MQASPIYRVFISSTSVDLQAYRTKIRDLLIQRQLMPIDMKDFEATTRDAVTLCRDEVLSADLLICIYAHRYGYIPENLPQTEERFRGKSITELEYLWAEEHGIDRLVFIVDPKATFNDSDPIIVHADTISKADDDDTQQEFHHQQHEKLRTFIDQLSNKVVWKYFQSPDNLALEVSSALTEWENLKQKPVILQQTPIVIFLTVFLWIISLGLLLDVLLKLLQAGETAVTVASGVIGILLSLIPIVTYTLTKQLNFSIFRKLPAWALPLIIQMIVLLIFLLMRQPILNTLAQSEIQQALRSTSLGEAQTHIVSAQALGMDTLPFIQAGLQSAIDAPKGKANDEQAILLSELLVSLAQNKDEALIQDLQSRIQEAIIDNQPDLLNRYLIVIANLDPTQAAEIANNFNDQAVILRNSNSADLVQARLYLQAVTLLDAQFDTARSASAISASLYNLGQLQQDDPSLSNRFNLAGNTYRKAIEIDANNIDAYVALSTLLYTQGDINAEQLEDAVIVAEQGIAQLESTSDIPCSRIASASNDETDTARLCFSLYTADGCARVIRGDSPQQSQPLLERSIQITEAFNHFSSGFYTAEPYYCYAQSLIALNQTPDKDLLCNIMTHRTTQAPDRFDAMAQFASNLLGNAMCLG